MNPLTLSNICVMTINEYTQENPRINQQDRKNITLTPRRSPNSALQLHTQKQCTARGCLPSLSLTTNGPVRIGRKHTDIT